MLFIKIILIIILLLSLWIIVDIKIGRYFHLKKLKKQTFPFRYSHLELITVGSSLYKELFADIVRAKHYVHIMFFIINDDDISNRFINLLVEQAKKGIEIRLLVDRIGSHKLSRGNIHKLTEHGVSFAYCHPIRLPFLFYSLNQRNHRKITIIDGKIGYLGGFNIGDEYLGKNKKLGKWRDYHLKITGEGVQDLQTQFLRDWYDDTKEALFHNKMYFPSLSIGPSKHQIVPTHGAYLKQTFLELIYDAKEEIIIGTPYFIPGRRITKALIDGLKKGITVKILVPLVSDHPLVREGEFPYFRKLLKYKNCHIYHYLDGFFHAKIILIDNDACDIGTANMDLRSLYLNHEANCIIYDQQFIKTVSEELKSDFSNSQEVSLVQLSNLPFRQKIKEWLAVLLAPLL
ncbi:MAG: cardiolipin synthase [Bacillaceae bacterium]